MHTQTEAVFSPSELNSEIFSRHSDVLILRGVSRVVVGANGTFPLSYIKFRFKTPLSRRELNHSVSEKLQYC
jgi:hypothetical protein